MKRNFNRSQGFTLVELIVVIAIMGILGVVFSDILVQALRTQNKVQVLSQVKQNGQTVLNDIIYEVQRSDQVICAGSFPDSDGSRIALSSNTGGTGQSQNHPIYDDVLVLLRQSVYTRFKYIPPYKENGKLFNGFMISETLGAQMLDQPNSNNPTETNAQYLNQATGGFSALCANDNFWPPDTGQNVISDQDPVNGVSLDYDQNNPVFASTGYNNEAVVVRFLAFQGVGAGKTFETTVDSGGILFTTTVDIRSTN